MESWPLTPSRGNIIKVRIVGGNVLFGASRCRNNGGAWLGGGLVLQGPRLPDCRHDEGTVVVDLLIAETESGRPAWQCSVCWELYRPRPTWTNYFIYEH
jgi:hypothetical protein